MHFTRLRETGDAARFDGIYFTVGNDPTELSIRDAALRYGIRANDTDRPEHSWLGKRKLTHTLECERIVGKTVFVSHTIRGYNIFRQSKVM